MLALTRKKGESIQIGDDITVHIIQVEGNQVRVAIEAPTSISILRTEILHKPLPLLDVDFIEDEYYQ